MGLLSEPLRGGAVVSGLWLWTFWSHFDPQASAASGGVWWPQAGRRPGP